MSIKKVFSLVFLITTVQVCGQSIPDGYTDTVRVKYDKKKEILTVQRKDFKEKLYTFKIKGKNDSLQIAPADMDSLLKVINRFSANKPVGKNEFYQKLLDTTGKGYFVFPGDVSPDNPPYSDSTVEELTKKLAEKENQIKYLIFGISGLIFIILSLIVCGWMIVKSKQKLQNEQQKDLTAKIIELWSKYFDKDKGHPDMTNFSPDKIFSNFAEEQKDLKIKQKNLEDSLYDLQNQLIVKDQKLKVNEEKIYHLYSQ